MSPPDYTPHVLREYALLADGERGALIGPHGDVVWMCVPRWDSDAVFAALIGGRGGYAVCPVGQFVWGGYYEPGSLIWRSHWITRHGAVECREALAFPGDRRRAVLLRRVLGCDGGSRVAVHLDPCADFGRQRLSELRRRDGVWTGRLGTMYLRWTGAPDARRRDRSLHTELDVAAGRHHDLVLEIGDEPLPAQPVDPDRAWRVTETSWQAQVPALENCLDPAETRQSYAVLRGLTSRSGGTVAAVTTSLPERAGAGRNYDYRYVWIRDQCYAGQAVAAAGAHPLLDDAVRYVSGRLLDHGDRLAPAYTTDGQPVPDQRHLDLPGYPGGYDIVGNWVNGQFQLDIFGESLLLFAAAARHDRLDAEHWRAAEVAAQAIGTRWREPDAGIWEIDDRAWTHSRLSCVSGLRAIVAARPSAARATEWLALADRILADTAQNAVHPSGYWQRSPKDPRLDAALLLSGLRGAVPADDPRTAATLEAYAATLTNNGYAYRFRQDDRPLHDAEGSFLLCGFLMALATHQQGRPVEAIAWCGPAPPAVRLGCFRRSTTRSSTRCAGTSRRRSSTPS